MATLVCTVSGVRAIVSREYKAQLVSWRATDGCLRPSNHIIAMFSLSITPFYLILLCITCQAQNKHKESTDLIKESNDRPLIFTTLGGGMVALDQNSGNILWNLKDEPVVKVPNENGQQIPQFLPDPRYGSLYMFDSKAGERQILKKLPFTIPQLVANAPCRSSDGILYTGKKIDTWFMIDPKTGIRKQVLGELTPESFQSNTCPLDPKCGIYVARTEYNILMHDPKNEKLKWNVTFFDYSSHNMGKDMSSNYGVVHFTSTSNGRITTFDRKTGHMMWSHDMQSPIVAAYILDREGLISVPFNAVGDGTMDHIIDVSSISDEEFKYSNIELFPSLYIGEHIHGLYALSSLVDKNTMTISADGPQPLLLEGPSQIKSDADRLPDFKPNINVHYTVDPTPDDVTTSYILLGHYSIPEYSDVNFRILSKPALLSMSGDYLKPTTESTQLRLIMGPKNNDEPNWYDIENTTNQVNYVPNDVNGSYQELPNSVTTQTELEEEIQWTIREVLKSAITWMVHQEYLSLKLFLLLTIFFVFAMLMYLQKQIKEFQQLSQSGTRSSNSSYIYNGKPVAVQEELEDGTVKIGKIIFNPEQILGKGCDGTFVYRGTFENRDVAVKRLLPDCFSFADREVALLSESDTHANVIRYYCMEQDKMFRYIALELCSATLQDYVQKRLESEYKVGCIEILQQATAGLAHLHSLDIVHRDIKPHNVLLSIPSNKKGVRVMISDFGLCKKLNFGRHSFSRRSGITGTEGWIAPEMLNNERTTTSVDIFSLGCVFYYVLTKGVHPFGNNLERQANILRGEYNLSHLGSTVNDEEVELATCLIERMLLSDAEKRPDASVVYNFPLFWNNYRILTFFQDVSDRIEKDPPGGPLEHGGIGVVFGDWRSRVDPAIANDLRKYRSYNGDSVRDLLRAMRNKRHHYRELSEDAQKSLGSIPDEFIHYWLSRFPTLLLQTWLQMQVYKNEALIAPYYSEKYEFSRDFLIEKTNLDEFVKYDCETIPENDLFIKSKVYYDRNTGKKIKTRKKNNVKKSTDDTENQDEDTEVNKSPTKPKVRQRLKEKNTVSFQQQDEAENVP